MNEHNCRVCGLYMEDLPWGEGGSSPTYDLCSCCGVEFGNEDYSVESAKRYRENWISQGAEWEDPREKPQDWDLEEQLTHIPQEFK